MTTVQVDGERLDVTRYAELHGERISWTLEAVKKSGATGIVEVGSHPWVMTAALADDPALDLLATVSAEEILLWPDDIHPVSATHEIVSPKGNRSHFKTYSFNIERRRVKIDERPDAVLACEIIEHLIRAPHVMLLNLNDWLSVDGTLIVTTPNGTQMMNPFRRSPRMPAYRAHCYERHSFVYSLPQLTELIELCGFSIVDAGHSTPYPCSGSQRIRKAIASIPIQYLSEKFHRMLYVVARKTHDVSNLSRAPGVYAPSDSWEFVSDPEYRDSAGNC